MPSIVPRPVGAYAPTLPSAELAAHEADLTVHGLRWVPAAIYAVGDVVLSSRGDRIRCTSPHTSSTEFTDDLPYWEAVDAPAEESMLLQQAAMSKGGSIGIGDVAAVALRFDDYHEAFQSTVYPLLTARGLPAGHATLSDLTAQSWSDGDSAANVLTRNKNGVEVWCHGLDHKDPSPWGLDGVGGLIDQIVDSKTTIEGWGVKVQGWMHPGVTPLGSEIPYGSNADTFDVVNSYTGLLIRQNYALSEMYAGGVYRNIPSGRYHGLNHVTVSDGVTLASAKANIDAAVQYRCGIELMCHSANLGVTGMSVVDFTALLDYIVAYWDAGVLEVLTPSGMFFADKGTGRVDLYGGAGNFDDAARWNLGTGRTIEASGGHSGSNFARITSSTTGFVTPNPRADQLIERGFAGETFLFDGWARSNGAGTTVSRVLIQDYDNTANLNLSLTKAGITTSWTRVRHAFTIPPVTTEVQVSLGRNSGDGIDWDDVSVKKV